MMYCYWDFNIHEEKKGPPLSDIDGVSSFLYPIMNSEKRCPFGILEVDYEDFQVLKKQYPHVESVPRKVGVLLASTLYYPPALILTREEIDKMNLPETITKDEFSEITIKLLHKYLEKQWEDQYVLAEVLVPKEIETCMGGFVWIFGYVPKIKLVRFCGSNYFGDYDHVSCFNLTDSQIKQLPVIEMKNYTIVDHKNKRRVEFDLTDENLNFDEIAEMIRIIR